MRAAQSVRRRLWHAMQWIFGARRQTVICREGIYYLLVLGFVICGALLRDINLLMVVAGMMVGPLLFNIHAVVMALRELSVTRSAPAAVCAGELLTVRIALTSKHTRRACRMVMVEDQVFSESGTSGGERQRPEVLFPLVLAGETRYATYSGRLGHRGRYCLGPLRVSTRFPLGLVRRVVTHDVKHALLVYPRLGRLTANWKRLHHEMLVGSRSARHRQGTMEAEFFGLRDWRSGDSHRNIHWRTTARRGELMVRQFEQQRNEDLLLLLDLWLPASASEEALERVEQAVSFAATAVVDLCRRSGSLLALGIAGQQRVFTRGAASPGLQGEMMEALALAQAGRKYELGDLLPEVLDQIPPGTTTVVLTTRPDALEQHALAAALPEPHASRWAMMPVMILPAGQPSMAEYFYFD